MLDPAEPEVLVDEPQLDGSLQLGALEYVVFASDWKNSEPPQLYGSRSSTCRDLVRRSRTASGCRPSGSWHAWVWKSNPNGMFDDWNPKVTCQGAELTTPGQEARGRRGEIIGMREGRG